MRALVTGLNGTVAPVLARHLERAGWSVSGWDRAAVPTDDPAATRRLLDRVAPDAFFHVATGPVGWAEDAARACAERGVPFVLTGSVSVFGRHQRGPFAPDAAPEPDDDYGRYKLDAERRVTAARPGALVVRIGWQIGEAPGSNNMLDYLHRQAGTEGRLVVSDRWIPSASFLDDTAAALVRLAGAGATGLYHHEGNPGLSLYEIARRLGRLHGRGWTVEPAGAPDRQNLMADGRLAAVPITDRLP